MASTGHVGSAETPSSSATARHTNRPATKPRGMPTSKAMAATVVACHGDGGAHLTTPEAKRLEHRQVAAGAAGQQ